MTTTNLVKWDDTNNRLTAYCDDDSGETEIGPVKWDDTNNRLELNCDSTDFTVKWNDAENKLEAHSVADGCCEPPPCEDMECNNDCATCFAANATPPYVTITFSGVTVCSGKSWSSVNGTYIVCRSEYCHWVTGLFSFIANASGWSWVLNGGAYGCFSGHIEGCGLPALFVNTRMCGYGDACTGGTAYVENPGC